MKFYLWKDQEITNLTEFYIDLGSDHDDNLFEGSVFFIEVNGNVFHRTCEDLLCRDELIEIKFKEMPKLIQDCINEYFKEGE